MALAAARNATRLPWPTWPARLGRHPPGAVPGPGLAPPARRRPPGHQAAPRSFAVVAGPLASATTTTAAANAAGAAANAASAQQASASIAHNLVLAVAGVISGVMTALLTRAGLSLLAAAAAGVTLAFIHFTPRSRPVERAYAAQVADTLLKVVSPPPFAPEDVLLARPAAAAALASALDPADGAPPGFFIIVTGAPGAGKTTLVRLALQELAHRRAAAVGGWEEDSRQAGGGGGGGEAGLAAKKQATPSPSPSSPPLPGGAAYVAAAAHPRSNFGRDLAAAVGFSFEEGVRTLDLVSRLFASSPAIRETANPTESLARAASALEEAARDLKARGAGRPLLVIDEVDRLAFRDPDALLDMVAYAKAWAESGLVTVAFVASDTPATLNLLRASPGFSRAAPPVVVAGPTQAEAVDFLAARLRAKGGGALPGDLASLAEGIHDDWLLLQKAAALLVAGAAVADVGARLLGEAEPRFAAAGLLDRTPHQAAGLALAHALAALPPGGGAAATLPPATFHRLVPDLVSQDALLQPEAKGGRAGSPFRYEPGVGLSFASAADGAYVRLGVLDRVAFGAGEEEGEGKTGGAAPAAVTAATPTVGEEAGVDDVK
jgi:KaiC/GvpD/RAD55 family RecA-like ATPase